LNLGRSLKLSSGLFIGPGVIRGAKGA